MADVQRKQYYAVLRGGTVGIMTNWSQCSNSVQSYSNASYQGFGTLQEAVNFLTAGGMNEKDILVYTAEDTPEMTLKQYRLKIKDQEMANDKPQECEQKGKKQKIKKEKGQNTTEGSPKAKTKDNSKDTTPKPASEAAAGEAGETPAVEEEKEEASPKASKYACPFCREDFKQGNEMHLLKNKACNAKLVKWFVEKQASPKASKDACPFCRKDFKQGNEMHLLKNKACNARVVKWFVKKQADEAEVGEDVVGDNEGPDDEAEVGEDVVGDNEGPDDEAEEREDVVGDNEGPDDEAEEREDVVGDNEGPDDEAEEREDVVGDNEGPGQESSLQKCNFCERGFKSLQRHMVYDGYCKETQSLLDAMVSDGAQFTVNDLLEEATDHVTSVTSSGLKRVYWMYMNIEESYFNNVKTNQNNIMIPNEFYTGGEKKSPIYKQLIKGLLFSVTLYKDTKKGFQLPTCSRTGLVGVQIAITKLIKKNSKLYFADFARSTSTGHVTLVVTRPLSEADNICKKKLIELNLNSNDFFKFNGEGVFEYPYAKTLWVDIFYTENINMDIFPEPFMFQKPGFSRP